MGEKKNQAMYSDSVCSVFVIISAWVPVIVKPDVVEMTSSNKGLYPQYIWSLTVVTLR